MEITGSNNLSDIFVMGIMEFNNSEYCTVRKCRRGFNLVIWQFCGKLPI